MVYTMKMEPVNLKRCGQRNDKNSNKRNRTERCVSYHYIPAEAKSHFRTHSTYIKSSMDIVVKKKGLIIFHHSLTFIKGILQMFYKIAGLLLTTYLLVI